MADERKKRGRDPVRRDELLGFIREQVLTGCWRPGTKLPPRTWFEEKFSASPATVQKAFEILCAEQVLESEPRKSTHVSLSPPHLSRYGLVLYGTEQQENLFSRSLVRAAEQLRRERGLRLDIYFDLDCRQDSPGHRELVYGVEHQLFAGLFFASKPHRLLGTPILDAPGIPRVMFSEAADAPTQLARLCSPSERLEERALEYLAQQGTRRVALLRPATEPQPERRERLRRKIAELGMECPFDYYLELPAEEPQLVAPVIELLFNRRNRERPDGFLVGDDNFLPPALAGLERALGPEARQVRVVSHANYPQTGEKPEFPVKFFYINVLGILERSIELIDDLRAGRSVLPSEVEIYEENQATGT